MTHARLKIDTAHRASKQAQQKVCQKACSFPKGGRKDQEERARRHRDRIEEGREAHTYLSHMCVWLQIDLKQQQKESTGSLLGKTNKGLGLVQDQQNNKARRKSKTSSCAGKQASKQKLASTKIHTYIKEPSRKRGEMTLFLSIPPSPPSRRVLPQASCCLLLLWLFLLASPP